MTQNQQPHAFSFRRCFLTNGKKLRLYSAHRNLSPNHHLSFTIRIQTLTPTDSSKYWAVGFKRKPNAPRKEQIIFMQRLFKQGFLRDKMTTWALAKYPNLYKEIKAATEETGFESVADVLIEYNISFVDVVGMFDMISW